MICIHSQKKSLRIELKGRKCKFLARERGRGSTHFFTEKIMILRVLGGVLAPGTPIPLGPLV